MKIALIFLCLFAVAYSISEEAEDTSLVDDAVPEGERSCTPIGGDCEPGNDCKCCNKWAYCKCTLFNKWGCSCVFGDAMVCQRKKEQCRDPQVMDFPKGPCFYSTRKNKRRMTG
uniref:Putative neurotoxin LTDF 06-01 n=1 Tax=Dolomedes fimbriatus TaxID=1432569 RepID=A0A0K1D8C3_9ARAC|nr:putative neurotoxin LTDF 06-01 [Dolomedes fimbriatus]